MAFNVITIDSKVNQADQFLESFSETDKTYYYMFYGRHYPYISGVVPEIGNSRQEINIDAYSNMIFAKRILPSDVCLSIPRVDWTSGIVYTQYDHRNQDLFGGNFYVGVQEGTNYNVFKCLFNNNGSISGVAPSFAAFSLVESADNETYDGYYETADGYQWKYMYSISDSEMSKFSTNRFIPLIANTEVSDFAISGSIDVVLVENPGAGYNNYFAGEFTANSDVGYLGNSFFYAIRSTNNTSPSSVNSFYSGCIMKITEGRGAGQYREVANYVNSGNARYVVLNEVFTIAPDSTSKYEITPKVTIDGISDAEAIGRAIIGIGNSVSHVEILDRGSGYFTAEARILQPNVAIESNTVVLVPIVSPPGGHGFSAKTELGAGFITISVVTTGDENGLIAPGQKFGQIGILKDPLFSNVELTTVKVSNTSIPGRDGSFIDGEVVSVFNPILQAATVTVTNASSLIVSNNPATMPPNNLVFPDGKAYIQAPNSVWYAANVIASNSTTLTLGNEITFSSNAAMLYISYSNTTGIHLSSTPSTMNIANASPFFRRNDTVIGLTTFSVAKIVDIQINNKMINDFTNINQLSIISIDNPVSTLSPDNFISDESNTSSCFVHSYANASHLYVTNIKGNMDAGTILTNETGLASITVADKYVGQIVKNSAQIVYIENHELVNREASTSQTKKLTIGF
jgi:hypothetical protein